MTHTAQSPDGLTGNRVFALLLAILVLAGCDGSRDRAKVTSADSAVTNLQGDDAVISALVRNEETCLALSGKMNVLSKGLMGLRLPASAGATVFGDEVAVTDLGPEPTSSGADGAIAGKSWPLSKDSQKVPGAKVDLWRPLLDGVESFEHVRVYVIDGEHPQGDGYRFEANAGFEGLAKMKSGEWRSLNGKMRLNWERGKGAAASGQAPGGAPSLPPDWRMTAWKTERLDFISSPKRLFVESLEKALNGEAGGSGRALLERLRRSLHYEASVKHYREEMKALPHPYFAPISANQKEGLAVADIDRDGFDDIYITVRLGTNMFLRNRGDGTFVEEGALRGLALPGHTTCALFADFDNDGDLDAMLGRS